MEATKTLKVIVLDSNDASRHGHWMEVHRYGCSDVNVRNAPETVRFPDWQYSFEASSKREIVEECASDFIREGSMTWEDGVDGHVHFAPCVKLPRETPSSAAEVQSELPIETPAPSPVPAGKHTHCPDCGFAFKTPQARCNSRAACERRQRQGRPAAEAAVAVEETPAAPAKADWLDRNPADVLDEYVADLALRAAAAEHEGSPIAGALADQLAHQIEMAAYVRKQAVR